MYGFSDETALKNNEIWNELNAVVKAKFVKEGNKPLASSSHADITN